MDKEIGECSIKEYLFLNFYIIFNLRRLKYG